LGLKLGAQLRHGRDRRLTALCLIQARADLGSILYAPVGDIAHNQPGSGLGLRLLMQAVGKAGKRPRFR
jgi:hypothetical protein